MAKDLFETAVRAVQPFLYLQGGDTPRTPSPELTQGIAQLKLSKIRGCLEADWFIGKAYEALGDYEESVKYFRATYLLEPERTAYIHEYVTSLLRINKASEAKSVLDSYPLRKDEILKFDEALCYVALGDNERAVKLLTEGDWSVYALPRVRGLTARCRKAISNS